MQFPKLQQAAGVAVDTVAFCSTISRKFSAIRCVRRDSIWLLLVPAGSYTFKRRVDITGNDVNCNAKDYHGKRLSFCKVGSWPDCCLLLAGFVIYYGTALGYVALSTTGTCNPEMALACQCSEFDVFLAAG